MFTKRTVDSRTIRRLGAELWRDGHQYIEFLIPEDLPQSDVLKIGGRLHMLRHRDKVLIVDFISEGSIEAGGTLVGAHYKRNRDGSYVEASRVGKSL